MTRRKSGGGERSAHRHVAQTTTLEDRLVAFARRSRAEAASSLSGEAGETLLRKAQVAEIALAPGGLVACFASSLRSLV
jgi:hypothetical protein